RSTYKLLLNHMLDYSKTVTEALMKKAVNEEKQAMTEIENENTSDLTVSGDGTWQKPKYT
ncbi:hypothetical protein HHI36_017279, partial [Cryptolaemus montrouzieri]